MSEQTAPPPKWVQDSIPDWAFARVAELVGYGDKHGPRGSRAGVAFARYIAQHEEPPVDRLREMLGDCWHLMTGPRGAAIDALTEALRARLPAAALAAIDEGDE
ncbi:hypothetical protein [Synechococcus phage Yong-M3-232]|nr:hypothetical protein [Synechococcus phage Yong-M3-232]